MLRELPRPQLNHHTVLATVVALVLAILLLLFCARAAGWGTHNPTPAPDAAAQTAR